MRRPSQIFDYERLAQNSWVSADHAILLAFVFCILGAALCTVATLGHLKEQRCTPEFTRYLASLPQMRRDDPAHRGPDFAGRRYGPTNVWVFPTTYGIPFFTSLAISALVLSHRCKDKTPPNVAEVKEIRGSLLRQPRDA
jgi:hypothetical protein